MSRLFVENLFEQNPDHYGSIIDYGYIDVESNFDVVFAHANGTKE